MTLLALGGYAEAGKDSVADYLVEKQGWTKEYFSSPLEQVLLTINPYIITNGIMYERFTDLYNRAGYTGSKKHPEVRRLLQVIGTEVGRNIFGENVWVNLLDRKVAPLLEEGQHVVVTGVRFENELAWVKAWGGVSAWVDRGGVPVNGHPSDNTISAVDFDYTIQNRGSLYDLYSAVDLRLASLV